MLDSAAYIVPLIESWRHLLVINDQVNLISKSKVILQMFILNIYSTLKHFIFKGFFQIIFY